MALPKITYPTFMTVIPSTGKSVKFRPFTSGEEKALLTAAESDEAIDVENATRIVIQDCYQGIDVDELTTYDIDYLFLQLRIKSVSPISELYFRNMECEKNEGNPCERTLRIKINLEDVKVLSYDAESDSFVPFDSKNSKTSKIQLTESVGVILRHPGFPQKLEMAEMGQYTEDDLIKSCIVSIYDEETVYTRDDFTKEELNDFFDALQSESKAGMQDFIRNIPTVRYETEFKCRDCGFTEKLVLEDLESFFG